MAECILIWSFFFDLQNIFATIEDQTWLICLFVWSFEKCETSIDEALHQLTLVYQAYLESFWNKNESQWYLLRICT